MTRRCSLLLFATSMMLEAAAGPTHGSLVIVGGGRIVPEIAEEFIRLAGGKDAPIVVIPTAGEANAYAPETLHQHWLTKAGCTNLMLLHTRNRQEADTATFTAPLTKARAVWMDGGRQWRLVDSYLHTRTEVAIRAVLERGGVVGGSSAGATIIGSYLVRGAREGNALMMAPGYEEGFGLLSGTAIDQHLLTRHREKDLIGVIDAHPDLLGIGIDESTAIVVRQQQFRVIGASKVAIYRPPSGITERYYFLNPGDVYRFSH